LANSALSLTALLGLPVTIPIFTITHYIARFNFAGEEERLHSLLAGCRNFLFRLAIAGSMLAVLLVKPLSEFFHFPRVSLMLAALHFTLTSRTVGGLCHRPLSRTSLVQAACIHRRADNDTAIDLRRSGCY